MRSLDILGSLVKNASPGIGLLDMKFKFLRCLIWIILLSFLFIFMARMLSLQFIAANFDKKGDARGSNSLVSSA